MIDASFNQDIESLPLVSVAIITYNQIAFLRECIESVLMQDYSNIEIIVADDGSTDGTKNMLVDYSKTYPGKFVLRLSEHNQGITKNSNEAYFACSGKYIAWMGGDDLMLQGKISAQVEWLEKDSNRVLCGHILHLCDKAGHIYGIHDKKHLISGVGPVTWIKKGTLYGTCSIMLRKENIPEYGFDERLPIVSDWKLWIDSLKNDSVYGYLNQVYGVYRKHGNNITNNRALVMTDRELAVVLVEKERPEFKKIIHKYTFPSVYYEYGRSYMLADKKRLAISSFLRSIKKRPSQWKSYLRILQVFLSVLCLKTYKKKLAY